MMHEVSAGAGGYSAASTLHHNLFGPHSVAVHGTSQANAGKFLGGRAAFDACMRAVMTLGGMGYSTEYQFERLFRKSIMSRIAPVTKQLILSFIAENVLDIPKCYCTKPSKG